MRYLITVLGTHDKLEHFATFEVKGGVGGRLNVPKAEPGWTHEEGPFCLRLPIIPCGTGIEGQRCSVWGLRVQRDWIQRVCLISSRSVRCSGDMAVREQGSEGNGEGASLSEPANQRPRKLPLPEPFRKLPANWGALWSPALSSICSPQKARLWDVVSNTHKRLRINAKTHITCTRLKFGSVAWTKTQSAFRLKRLFISLPPGESRCSPTLSSLISHHSRWSGIELWQTAMPPAGAPNPQHT